MFAGLPEPTNYLNCKVLFRGYIANRGDLIGLTCTRPSDDLPLTDAQLFAAAYCRWGSGLQKMVYGEYCGVVFDKDSHEALITQDALALRPLFYSTQQNCIYFSSHLDALAQKLRFEELCDEYVADYLTLSRHFGSKTIFQGCERLEPGCSLLWQRNRLRKIQSWNIDEIPAIELESSEQYEECFRELLTEAVQRSLGNKTWVELSGGLDSSSIFCVARELETPGLEAISIVYSRSKSADERDWMREVISTSKQSWNWIDEDLQAPFSDPPDIRLFYPHQASLSWKLFKRYEQLVTRNRVDVVLSGMGGDQVFYGGASRPVFLADDLRTLRIFRLIKELRNWRSALNRSSRHVLSQHALQPLRNYYMGHRISEGRLQSSYCPWLSEGFLKRTGLATRTVPGTIPRASSVQAQDFLEDLQVLSSSSEQHWNQLINGFEIRFPLLYRPLVEFMSGIPLKYKIRPDEDRVLQRRSLVGILPERVRCRRDKRGPDQAFFDGLSRNKRVIDILTNHPQIVHRGYVDLTAWRSAVQGATFGSVPRFSAFFASVALELWLQQSEWCGLAKLD